PLQLGSSTTPAAERYAAAHFVEEVKQWILQDPRFGATAQERRDLLFGGGLRIHTTLDLRLQAQAEAAVAEVLPDPNGPDASLVAIEPATGHVKRSEEHTSELQSRENLVCRLLLEKKKKTRRRRRTS